MKRTQTRLRMGFGLVAMVAVLALVAFMTMVNSSAQTSANTGEPDPDYKALAKVTSIDDLGPPVALTITKEPARLSPSAIKSSGVDGAGMSHPAAREM